MPEKNTPKEANSMKPRTNVAGLVSGHPQAKNGNAVAAALVRASQKVSR